MVVCLVELGTKLYIGRLSSFTLYPFTQKALIEIKTFMKLTERRTESYVLYLSDKAN